MKSSLHEIQMCGLDLTHYQGVNLQLYEYFVLPPTSLIPGGGGNITC